MKPISNQLKQGELILRAKPAVRALDTSLETKILSIASDLQEQDAAERKELYELSFVLVKDLRESQQPRPLQ